MDELKFGNFLHKMSITTLGGILHDLNNYREELHTDTDPESVAEELTQTKEELDLIWEVLREKSGVS